MSTPASRSTRSTPVPAAPTAPWSSRATTEAGLTPGAGPGGLRILAVADEVDDSLTTRRLRELAPGLLLSAGDLPFEYLEFLVSTLDVPLVFVPGNHDPDLSPRLGLGPLQAVAPPPGPGGGENADGRVVDAAGVRIAGLGGSLRYRPGANQYRPSQMRRRALLLAARARLRQAFDGRGVDIVLAHSPPFAVGDGADPAHRGFAAFDGLLRRLRPRLLIHGHVHPYGRPTPPHHLHGTEVVNVIPHRLLTL